MIFFNASTVPEWILLVGSAWFTGLILNDVVRGTVEVRPTNSIIICTPLSLEAFVAEQHGVSTAMLMLLNVHKYQPRLMSAYRTNVLQPGAMTAQLDYYRAALRGGSKEAKSMAVRAAASARAANLAHLHAFAAQRENRLGPKKDGSPGRKLSLPVLMVRGKQDIALLGGLFEHVQDYLADSRLVELDNCSHWVQHDASPELNKELDTFLAELDRK